MWQRAIGGAFDRVAFRPIDEPGCVGIGQLMKYAPLSNALLALVLATATGACGNDDPAPFAPAADGGTFERTSAGTQPTTGGSPGAGGGLANQDGSGPVADDLPAGCIAVEPDDIRARVRITRSGAVVPFPVSRAQARLTTNALGEDMILVSLTDGSCERGVGRQLDFEMDADAIGDGVLLGDNEVRRDPSPLRIRFNDFRTDPEVPEVFGTCSAEDVAGNVRFDALSPEEGALTRATFTGIRLGPCTAASDPRPLTFDGSFELDLADSGSTF